MAQEGKSTITANLAAALALAELRVLVVDADLRKPQQHRLFRSSRAEGLTSALLEGSVDGRVKQVEPQGLEGPHQRAFTTQILPRCWVLQKC